MRSKILIVDDEAHCIEAYKRIFSDLEREIDYFQSPEEAFKKFQENPFFYSLALIDYQYCINGEIRKLGVHLAKQIKSLNNILTVCIVSGDESQEALQFWLKASIDNYLYKPLRKREATIFAEHHVLNYERHFSPMNSIDRKTLGKEILDKFKIVGESETIVECAQMALRFSKSDLHVLLLGETGTGKELFAHGIHNNSENARFGIFPVNCSSYKENSQLLEVELFGSERGAFTGAENKIGILERANGGTVFLDEIHHLNEAAQFKLLRVLQEKKIRRVGGQKEYPVRFRLIAAGKPDLFQWCGEGKFSPDLFYRLKGLDLLIPPLRDRKRDIAPLVAFFLREIKKKTGEEKQISARTLEHLEKYDWPGNIRELQQFIEKLNVLIDEDVIVPKHLPEYLCSGDVLKGCTQTLDELDEEYRRKQIALILNTFDEVNHNLTEATKRLGLGEKRSTLRSRMKQLKIKDLSKREKTGLLHQLTSNL